MLVTCACGKRLNVADHLAGKRCSCPHCKGSFVVVPSAEAPEPKIRFACACGKKLMVDPSFAGKKVLCPACDEEALVPKAPLPGANSQSPATGQIQDFLPPETAPHETGAERSVEPVEGAAARGPSQGVIIGAAVAVALVAGAVTMWLTIGRSRPTSGAGSAAARTEPAKHVTPSTVPATATTIPAQTPAVPAVPAVPVVSATTTVPAAPAQSAATTQPAAPSLPSAPAPASPAAEPPKVRQPGIAGLQDDIQAFKDQYGRFPMDLTELKDGGYQVPVPPAGQKYNYNETTGVISLEAIEQ